MRLVVNTGYVKRRKRLARLMVFIGLLVLISSFFLTFYLQQVFISYIPLILGFILFNSGMQGTTKWSNRPRPDEVLDNQLRRLNDRYTLIHYPNIRGYRPEHLLVYPGGLVVITTRIVMGQVRVENNRWHRSGKRLLSFFNFGGPQLGNPTLECERQQSALRDFIQTNALPGEDVIEGMIAFLSPRAELEVISSDLTVVTAPELLDAVRDLGTEALLPTKQREEIIAALSEGEGIEGPTPLPSRDQKPAKGARARS